MKDGRVEVRGGRRLAYTDLGDPRGRCVFYFHGAPSSRLHLVGSESQLAAQGLRVVTPDRPGYGGSSPQLERSIADWPGDVATLADALGIERFMVAGHSSGGPYAVACAAVLSERVVAGAVLAGVTDMAWPSAWDGFIEDEVAIMRQPDESSAVAWCSRRFGSDGRGFLGDTPVGTPGDPMAEAMRQGIGGYARDVYVQGRPWPFDPARIRAPIEVSHGELDTLVPVAHSRHTAELIPGSILRIYPGRDHMTLVSELPGIVRALSTR